jgi:hypothetical protein
MITSLGGRRVGFCSSERKSAQQVVSQLTSKSTDKSFAQLRPDRRKWLTPIFFETELFTRKKNEQSQKNTPGTFLKIRNF